MATQVRLRRGTTAEHASFTGAEGEITVDTDKDVIVVHDGSTAGGIPMTRADFPRGFTKIEHFTNNGTWTKTNKTDLKRIEVHVYGGGGGGGNNTSGGSGGGSGGHGYAVIEASALSTNVAVNIGSGGSSGGAGGGASSFGTYINANGGGGGQNNNFGIGGNSGTVTGNASGLIEIGGFAGSSGGYSATANASFGWVYGTGGGPGSNRGNAVGVFGGGGGAANGSGAPGSVVVFEIYGEY